MTFTDSFEKQSRLFFSALSLAFVVIAGIIDYLTGPEYSVSVLYLIPVIIAAWYAGRRISVAIAFASAGAWLVAALLWEKHFADTSVIYWNDIIELSFFLLVSYIISALKSSLDFQKMLARTDSLTGVSNRTHFYLLAETEINRSRRYKHPFTICYIDIDNFKQINDTLGHGEGDDLLRRMTEKIRTVTRKTDIVGRLGGDEFGLLMPETDERAALNIIEKVHRIGELPSSPETKFTLSIGMVTYLSPPADAEEMMKTADSLMYSVKMGGKNNVLYKVLGESAA
jgi:diguanylate cyclase (GGDEF)-like protein